jgi:LuxR family transcriptional regulator, maltose regulon positive regulatory protein
VAQSRVDKNCPSVTGVLATKLFEPTVPRALLSRPRLVKRFNDGLSARVTLVSAPAGYGKSTLLSEWRATPEGAVTRLAWMSVDEADGDPARFWSHVAAALQNADPAVGVGLAESLRRPDRPPLDAQLEVLLNELAGLDDPLVLVLDDLHAVSNTDVLESLAFLVVHLPPQVHLVVTSRTDPPLPLASLRARGELSEVRMPDLRFTGDELDAYFDGLGIILDADSLRTLGARTEGWAAGLHLAALTLADVEDRAAVVRRFAGDDRTVLDYFAEEVLARQPVDIQDFLLATSVLERMCGPLCDAVTGRFDGQANLRAVENANLFLVPLDNSRTWFRYHHLFSELLRRELNVRGTIVEAELRERAARWLASEGLIEEAVPQAVAAEAWDLAFDLGTRHGVEMVVQGHSVAFRQLYGSSYGTFEGRLEATLGKAWMAALAGDLYGAQRWLDTSDAALTTTDDVPAGALIDAALLHALLDDRRGDIAGCLARVDIVLELLERHPEVSGLDRVARHARALLFMARAALMRDEFGAAGQLLAEAFAVQDEHRPARGIVEALGQRSVIALCDGRTDAARRDAEDALDLEADRRLEGTPHGAWAHLTLGIDHTEHLELVEAEEQLRHSLEVLRNHHDVNGIGLASAAMADCLRLAGRPHDAVTMVRATIDDRMNAPPMPPLVARRLARAEAWARVALGELEVTEAVAGVATSAALGPGRRREQIEALVNAGLAAAGTGDHRAALDRLAESLRLAAPTGWLAPFTERGEPLRALFLKLPPDADRSTARLAKQVLDAFARRRSGERPRQPLIEQLSERELDVLRRLPSKLSNQEIAALLYVSLNTVKTQIQSIYRKLGVNSRHEAIERARQLDLL